MTTANVTMTSDDVREPINLRDFSSKEGRDWSLQNRTLASEVQCTTTTYVLMYVVANSSWTTVIIYQPNVVKVKMPDVVMVYVTQHVVVTSVTTTTDTHSKDIEVIRVNPGRSGLLTMRKYRSVLANNKTVTRLGMDDS